MKAQRTGALAAGVWLAYAAGAGADTWTNWGKATVTNTSGVAAGFARLATDGTNLYYATTFNGVYRAALTDHVFSAMPMTGFPGWSAANSNGFALWNVGVSPQGVPVISGSPVNVINNSIYAYTGVPNAIPVFYYWDENASQWQPAAVTGQTYPYTAYAGNFANAPDGSLWTTSGFASYVYRSTDGGRSYQAFDIDASVPADYFPLINGETYFGKIFGVAVAPGGDVVVGSETGGFLHTANNGLSWTSLDPDFTNAATLNPLGRIGNAGAAGFDRFGNVVCNNAEFSMVFPGSANWAGVQLIGYRPGDGTYFKADFGLPATPAPGVVVTTASGISFTYMNQNYARTGGIYRSADGMNWSQFNTGISGLTNQLPPALSNAVIAGGIITAHGNTVWAGVSGGTIYSFDTTPQPVTNHPPSALPANFAGTLNTPMNLTLTGFDADHDALQFTLVTQPRYGVLTGTPPNLSYTPLAGFTGSESFQFTVSDGQAVSSAATVLLDVNGVAATPPQSVLVSPADLTTLTAPASVTLAATASDPQGIQWVEFWQGTNLLGAVFSPPYSMTVSNLTTGTWSFSANAVNPANSRGWSKPARVVVTGAPAQLTLVPAPGGQMTVAWPLPLMGALLETAPSVTGPWSLVASPPVDLNRAQHAVTVPAQGPAFFRLRLAP